MHSAADFAWLIPVLPLLGAVVTGRLGGLSGIAVSQAVDDWAVIIGGDSHTRMSKGVAFGADPADLHVLVGHQGAPAEPGERGGGRHPEARDAVHARLAGAAHEQPVGHREARVPRPGGRGRVVERREAAMIRACEAAYILFDWAALPPSPEAWAAMEPRKTCGLER